MRIVRFVLLALLALTATAHAQTGSVKSPAQLNAEINLGCPDNTTGVCTPVVYRQDLLDIVASTIFRVFPDQFGTVDRTGATDMGGIINSAITAAKHCGTGGPGTVILTAGTYLITTPIVPKSCVSIRGEGRGQVVLLTNNAAPFSQVAGSQLVHFELSGVTFKDSGSHPNATVLSFTTIQASRIKNIGFHGYTTGTAMIISSNNTTISTYDDTTNLYHAISSFMNTFEDWIEDDSMAYGIVIAGWLTTPCDVNTATAVVTLNTFKDIQLYGITAVGWDLVRAADSNQFIGVNVINLIGSGAAVNTPHANFRNIAVQLGDDNGTCAGNNDIALERLMYTTTLTAPATSLIPVNIGNNSFSNFIDYQTDILPANQNGGVNAQAGVTTACYSVNGRNYFQTLYDGVFNLHDTEIDTCKYHFIFDGASDKPALGFALEQGNGIYHPAMGVFGITKQILAPSMVATAAAPTVAAAQIGYGSTTVAPAAAGCPSGTVGGKTVAGCIVINIAGTTSYLAFYQ